ncbi:MAG: gamma-glutamyl-gamma-aminobutyrate hydrolase family protein [Verrucomicrobiota bacterium]
MTKSVKLSIFSVALVAIASLSGYFVGQNSAPSSSTESAEAPLIGIASLTSDNYVNAVRESGGIPIVLPNAGGGAPVEHYLELLDGLLLPGGADIPPSEYGEEPHETVKLLDDDRFQFEKALSRAWIEETDKPLLGICLGSQWINVSSGGSLIQDIPSEYGISHRDRKGWSGSEELRHRRSTSWTISGVP